MKNYLTLVFIIILAIHNITDAQDIHDNNRCSTVSYNQEQELKHPWIRKNREKIEDGIQQYLSENPAPSKEILVIPTVVHVVWNTPEQNISDEQVWSQIITLNEDFRRKNPDTIHTPAMFKPVAADCQIEFCLARRTPGDTAATYGIVRVHTDSVQFGIDNQVKNPYEGGSRAWDPKHYLNIWVCNLAGNFLGYSQYPGGVDSTDGVVIDYKCFGSVGDLNPHYNKGRTATHEIGHWLDLWHIWGDDFGSCDGTDYVDDTPNAADANYYCPAHPHTSNCNATGEMFMNYMDYCDDVCFNIFTAGQRNRMFAAINTSRPGLLTSDGCVPYDAIPEIGQQISVKTYPNPVKDVFTIEVLLPGTKSLTISLTDVLGNKVYSYHTSKLSELHFPVDAREFNNGIYFLDVQSDNLRGTSKLIILH